jgi:hypothetical protein
VPCWLLVLALSVFVPEGQTPAATPITGTEISSEFSWERRTDVALDAHTAVFGAEPYFVTFSITFTGLRQRAAPASVDILLGRDGLKADVAAASEPPSALFIIDNLPAPLTRQTADGPDRIKAVVPFEVFEWMVGGKTLAFEAFGHRLELAPRQIALLKATALEWAHPRG